MHWILNKNIEYNLQTNNAIAQNSTVAGSTLNTPDDHMYPDPVYNYNKMCL